VDDSGPQISAATATPTVTIALSIAASPTSAYPGPAATPIAPAYPIAEATASAGPTTIVSQPGATATAKPTAIISQPEATGNSQSETFLPMIQVENTQPSTEPTETPPESVRVPTVAPVAALDFAAIRSELNSSGQELANVKIGFHVTVMDEATMQSLFDYLTMLDSAGVPFFLKSAGNAEPLLFAQQLMAASGVPHTLVYRSTNWDVPVYDASPEDSARLHWQRHRDAFPPELDPSVVWIETLNEVDKNRSDWLARFALSTAELSLAEGYRWAAFSWSSGEPEPEDWQSPAMLEFLKLAGNNPERLAIALHEYSFLPDDIGHDYPYKIGRFLELFRIADQYNIPRPTVLITEWGWAYDSIPPRVNRAMRDVAWAAALYAPFPQIKGAAIWTLGSGCCFGGISTQVAQLIPPLAEFSLTHYFTVPLGPEQAEVDPNLYQP
jgi:hypothetical protein